jgi:ferric-dicitrate binding protein FerR (iron transport regulator)
VAGDTHALRDIGLSSGNAGTSPEEILFGLRVQDGRVEVREQGAYKAERTIAGGDSLRISVRAGTVSYLLNGAVFYTSAATPTYPLLVDTSLFDLGASLSTVTLAHP